MARIAFLTLATFFVFALAHAQVPMRSGTAPAVGADAGAPLGLPPAGAFGSGAGFAAGPRLVARETPGWFRVSAPEGWQVLSDRASGRIAVIGPDGRGVHIWMLLVPRAVEPAEAEAMMSALSGRVAPQARWSKAVVKQIGSQTTASTDGRDKELAYAAGLSLVRVDRVTIALHAMAWAPPAAFEQSRALFASVLETFEPLPGGGGDASAAVGYERWSDPSEGAFSVEVPKGWKVAGGTFRKSAIDVRQAVHVASPDGLIAIQAGDPEIPPFTEPGPYLVEGQYNGPALIRRYTPGALFGRDYLMWRVKPEVPDLAFDAMRPLPELQQLVQRLIDAYPIPGFERRVDIGEVLFHGTWKQKPARGHLYVATSRVAQQGGLGMWFTGALDSLQEFLAAEEKIPLTVEVTNHMRETFAMNLEWVAAQQRTTMAASRIMAETNRYVSDLIRRSYERRQATYDSIFERYSKYQRDVVDVVDPVTQEKYEVQAGSNYYWIDHRGRIVGTETSFNPNPLWFREMLKVGR